MPHNPTTDLALLTHQGVRSAIEALQSGNANAWFAQFTSDAELYDDGNKHNLREFWEKGIGHEYFTAIDKVENHGLHLYGHFHSDTYGNFKTYFKFHFNAAGLITRLEIGQADY